MIARMLLVMVALVGIGALSTACNGDGGGTLTLEEYFQKIEDIDSAQTERQEALEGRFGDLGEESSVDEAADLFDEQVDLLRDFQEEMEDVEAPSEVEDAHNGAVDAIDALAVALDDFAEKFREADSIEEAFGQFEDSDFAELDRLDEACLDIVQIGVDNGIEVALDCESDD